MGETASVGTMKVRKKLWRRASRVANSVSGMRWPIPGVGTMTICGGGAVVLDESWVASIVDTEVIASHALCNL
ncbi:hypothetical protein RHGRI_005960 [Rhododendron griersonianum]|uniref:Uncharacterized protein n=1 Tax=Rhododendron griersonianum TaxID=479676 RepID=A0AAV6LGV0_9ERIC|nr:hypothetical protein RHGRI_005960 [Rhododendron griersonianum]